MFIIPRIPDISNHTLLMEDLMREIPSTSNYIRTNTIEDTNKYYHNKAHFRKGYYIEKLYNDFNEGNYKDCEFKIYTRDNYNEEDEEESLSDINRILNTSSFNSLLQKEYNINYKYMFLYTNSYYNNYGEDNGRVYQTNSDLESDDGEVKTEIKIINPIINEYNENSSSTLLESIIPFRVIYGLFYNSNHYLQDLDYLTNLNLSYNSNLEELREFIIENRYKLLLIVRNMPTLEIRKEKEFMMFDMKQGKLVKWEWE